MKKQNKKQKSDSKEVLVCGTTFFCHGFKAVVDSLTDTHKFSLLILKHHFRSNNDSLGFFSERY